MHFLRRGYVTVYLAMMLGILVMLFEVIIVGVRNHTIRFAAECVMDMGLNSIFAEYNRDLFDRYGLLYIDPSYGGEDASPENTAHRLLHYMNINFEDDRSGIMSRSITGLKADNCELSGITYASDGRGEALRYQIGQLMKSKMLIDGLDDVLNTEVNMDESVAKYNDYCSQRDSADERIDSIIDEMNRNLPEDVEPYSVSNPANAVEHMGDDAVLYYAIGDALDTPMAYINKSDYISSRNYIEGAGLRSNQRYNDIADKALLISYLYDVCGCYGNIRDGSRLNYQLEYIIANKDSDKGNLAEIAKYIFMLRYPVNMSYLLTSPIKRAEAETMALAAASAIMNPELTEALTYSILFAWGYAESAKDVRIIFDGHPIPMVKDDLNWNTPLSQMVNFKSFLNIYTVRGGQLNYKKILRGLLMTKSTENLSMRFMDIVEMDLRKIGGNQNFKMNTQIYQLAANVNLSSAYGHGVSIKRFYSYE